MNALMKDAKQYLMAHRKSEFIISSPIFHFGRFQGKQFRSVSSVCYASMESWYGENKLVYAWTPYEDKKDPAYRAFIAWVCSPVESPWRKYIPKDIDADFVANHGMVLDNVDEPANVLVNLLIALRYPAEFPEKLLFWHRLVQNGVSPTLAFMMTSVFRINKNTVMSLSSYEKEPNHFPIWGRTSVAGHLLCGKMVTKSFIQPLRVSGIYRPCNDIWGHQVGEEYDKFLTKKYPKAFSVEEQKDRWGDVTSCKGKIDFDDFLKVCAQEEKRNAA